MRILGLDVSKNNVCCALLTDENAGIEPRQLYLEMEFPRLYATHEGIKAVLGFLPDVAVLEPTGVNYSRIWCQKLAAAGVKVVLVGHKELRYHRIGLDLPDKSDAADSLALAHYYWVYQGKPSRFVRERDEVISQMREISLRLNHCARVQNPLINRIRQDLAWQYPEAAKRRLDGALFWRWLAGEGKSLRYDSELANTAGQGITEETRELARILQKVLRLEATLELQLTDLLSDAKFVAYRKVFAKFGFGRRTEALILAQIYPIENYLKDGKPEKIVSQGKTKALGTKTVKPISRRKFMKALGAAPVQEQSGDSRKTKKAGSGLCRKALWLWVFTRLEAQKARPPKLPIVHWHPDGSKREEGLMSGDLAEYLDWMKRHKPIKLARSKTMAKATDCLFSELAKIANPD